MIISLNNSILNRCVALVMGLPDPIAKIAIDPEKHFPNIDEDVMKYILGQKNKQHRFKWIRRMDKALKKLFASDTIRLGIIKSSWDIAEISDLSHYPEDQRDGMLTVIYLDQVVTQVINIIAHDLLDDKFIARLKEIY